jgi:hypothetical protein
LKIGRKVKPQELEEARWQTVEERMAVTAIGSTYNLTMDPFEKYDMTFNGAVSTRISRTS